MRCLCGPKRVRRGEGDMVVMGRPCAKNASLDEVDVQNNVSRQE